MNAHTPGLAPKPWYSVHSSIYDAERKYLGRADGDANAALIVRAVNERADLLAALEWALSQVTQPIRRTSTNGEYVDAYEQARTAIAKARTA